MTLTKATYSMIENAPVNVQDYGAVGDGVTDDTAAIQAALNAIGTFSYPNATSIASPTATGTSQLFLPAGEYVVSNTLLFPADCDIYGVGYNTRIKFTATSGVNLFEKNPAKTTKYAPPAATTENVRFRDMLLLGAGSGTAIYANNVEKLRLDNVVIYNFNTGLFIDDIGGGEAYYHYITNCNIYDNVINLFVGTAVATFVGCYFWHSNLYTLASYNIILEGSQITFSGCSIEGRPSIAQIYNKLSGLVVAGGYSETRSFATVGLKPFIKQLVSNDNVTGAPLFTVTGIRNATYLFENFDIVASDALSSATAPRYPLIGMSNPGSFIPALQNGDMRYGVYGWVRNVTENAGTVTFDAAKYLNSFGAVKLTHDGTGNPLSLNILPSSAQTSAYVGRRFWVTALVYAENTITDYDLVLFGAGNTQTKFSSEPVVDFGNGWKLIAVDAPILSTAAFTCFLRVTSSTANAALWATNIQCWVDGYDLIPFARSVDPVVDTSAPTTGTWARGSIVYNSTPSAGGTPGWVCTTAGTPGTWKAMANLAP